MSKKMSKNQFVSAENAFISQFISEVKPSLEGIVAVIDLLRKDESSNSSQELLNALEHYSRCLEEIAKDSLEIAKFSQGDLHLRHESLSVRTIIEESLDQFQDLAESKDVHLAAIIDPSVPKALSGDFQKLKKVVDNLLKQALNLTWNGRVLVRASAQMISKNKIRLSVIVSDTGMGIPAELLHTLFQPFSKKKNEFTETGFGLGLALAKMICQQMKGQIKAESDLGSGSTITATMELKIVEATLDARPSLRQISALIVANDINLGNILLEQLRTRRMGACEQVTPEKALHLLKKSQMPASLEAFDLIIILADDSNKKLLAEVLDSLKNDVNIKNLPVVLLTSQRTTLLEGSFKNHISHVLHLPFKQSDLYEIIAKISGEISNKTIQFKNLKAV